MLYHSRSIFFLLTTQQYETALNKHNQGRDPNILSCLGRVWYAKGKKESKTEPEKAFDSLKNSLEYAKKVGGGLIRTISRGPFIAHATHRQRNLSRTILFLCSMSPLCRAN